MLGEGMDRAAIYTDFQGMAELRREARDNSPDALRAAAKQFESIFVQMMLQSMRQASLGEEGGIMDNDQTRFYTEMYDKQLVSGLSGDGHGIGLADVLVRQLGGVAGGAGVVPAPELNTSVPARQPLLHATLPTTGAGPLADATSPSSTEPTGGLPPPVAALAPNAGTDIGMDACDMSPVEYHGVAGLEAESVPAATPAVEPVVEPVVDQAPLAAAAEPQRFESPQQFVRTLWPHAVAAGRELGVEPRVLIAQAALETGWGRAVIRHPDGSSSYNLFNIKASGGWQGDSVSVGTLEYRDGVARRERAAFRAYDSWGESFRDYARLISGSSRYRPALQQAADPDAYMRALQQAGYATDPRYASKVTGIMNADTLNGALAALKFSAGGTLS